MKQKLLAMLLCIVILLSSLPACAREDQDNSEHIVILYENDVHCAVDGYTKLAMLKNELKQSVPHVGVVSVGDYVQGGSLGSISKGEYIVNLMNLVGYDAVTLGNHEFDYHLPRLSELVSMMNTKPVCCNFQKIGEGNSYFEPYKIVSYGDVDIAYIGVTTPETVSSSSPAQFKNENGEFIYTFHSTDLYEVVQTYINEVQAKGADYIVALSHIGDNNGENAQDVYDLIENTSGLDVVLDGHSHSVIEGIDIKDKSGNEVRLSSTGTKFQNIGKLTIRDGEISTELISTEAYEKTDDTVNAYLEKINAEYSILGERKIATSDIDLITHDAEGNRLIRTAETNLGNLCGDALRYVLDADVGYAYGGGIRNSISKGDVTFNDLLSVFPYNNQVVLCEITGQVLLDVLETSLLSYPSEDGRFPQMSGVTFSVDTSISSNVVMDENEEFVGVNGEYRVYNVKVYDKESGEYLPLDLNKKYTFASVNYTILEYGSGMTMFKGATILKNDGMLDVEMLESYITEFLNGHIGEEYSETRHAITFTEGKE